MKGAYAAPQAYAGFSHTYARIHTNTHARTHTDTDTHTHTQMKGAFRHGTKLNTVRHMGGRGVPTRLPPGGMRFANPIQEHWVLRPSD